MRIFRKKEEWEALLKEQKESGKSVSEFCKNKNIHPNIFYRKRRELSTNNSFIKITAGHIKNSRIRLRIKDVIIEPEKDHEREELVKIIQSVLEAVHADV